MKTLNVAFVTLFAVLPAFAAKDSPQHRGTDVLHYSVREAFTADTNASAQGSVYLTRKEQGNSQKQTLDVVLTKLTPSTSYWLLSLNQDDTNYTFVTDFDSDSKGKAKLRYVNQGNGQSLGRGKQPLSALLDPVSGLGEIVITDSATQTVAVAKLTEPDKLSYLVKRDLSTSDYPASLRLKANQETATLKLVVSGLQATNDYWLALNGEVTETNAATADGKLVIDRRFDDPLEVLNLKSIELLDTTTNAVISTTLP
jgi:hypothetical protein